MPCTGLLVAESDLSLITQHACTSVKHSMHPSEVGILAVLWW